jgi:hypothetical protein
MKTWLPPAVTFVVAVGLIGLGSLALPETLLAAPNDGRPTITVQIYNYSPASPEIVARAEREAGSLLSAAGLQPVWLECPVKPPSFGPSGLCQNALLAGDLRLRILPASVQNKSQDSVFGFAIHPALASVYYDYAQRRPKVDDAEFEFPMILGGVMAHELGHLLLGSDGHSATGIMQPLWDPRQVRLLLMGTLQFTPEQTNRMILAAQARTEHERNDLSSISVAPKH